MNRAALVTVLVVTSVVAGAAAATTGGAGPPDVEPTPATVAPDNASNNTSDASLGASISAFMQSNAEQADQAVAQGMWNAQFDRSDRERQDEVAESHVNDLRQRLDEITDERRELVEAYRAGEIGRLTFQARMSALQKRYRAVARSVDDTGRTVARSNVTPRGLADLEQSVRRGQGAVTTTGNGSLPANVTLPGFDGDSPDGPFAGDPANRTPVTALPGPGNESPTDPRNRSDGPPGNGDGPPGDGDGPPGNGDGSPGNGTGPPDATPGDDPTENVTTASVDDELALGELLNATAASVAGANAEQTRF